MDSSTPHPEWPFPEKEEPEFANQPPAAQPTMPARVRLVWKGIRAWFGCPCESCHLALVELLLGEQEE